MDELKHLTEKKEKTMPHGEQWKVTSDNYKKTFESKDPAKRQFGKICAEIEKDGDGSVTLEYRPASTDGKDQKWIEVEEFELIGEDEDEDENEDEDEDED
jgi:hypothetical protein